MSDTQTTKKRIHTPMRPAPRKFPLSIRETIYLEGIGDGFYQVQTGTLGGRNNTLICGSAVIANAIVRCLRQLAVDRPNLLMEAAD